jgi:hypothetical protein
MTAETIEWITDGQPAPSRFGKYYLGSLVTTFHHPKAEYHFVEKVYFDESGEWRASNMEPLTLMSWKLLAWSEWPAGLEQ